MQDRFPTSLDLFIFTRTELRDSMWPARVPRKQANPGPVPRHSPPTPRA